MALAFLVILFFVVIGGGLLVVAVFGARAAPNPEGGGRPGRSLFPARALCVVGVGFAVVGAFFVSVATDVLGMVLGMVGYFLGARVLGTVVVILSIATLLIGLLVGPGRATGLLRPADGRGVAPFVGELRSRRRAPGRFFGLGAAGKERRMSRRPAGG